MELTERQPDVITPIDDWPDGSNPRSGFSSPKVPTELRYVSGGVEWGGQIPPFVERHGWFKL